MKKLIFLFPMIIFACQQGVGPLTQADKDAIQKTIDTFAEAVRTSSSSIGDVYTDDIVSMPPHETAVSGKQNVAAFHNEPGPTVESFNLNTQEIEGAGSLAYARGTWSFAGTLNDSIPIKDNGKFMVILKKQADNSWKTSRETWNSDLPLADM